MKRIAKICLPVLLALSFLITSIPAYAAAPESSAEQSAASLHQMGLFAGTSSTGFVPDLDLTMTREQGIALVIRLMGLDADAQNMSEVDVVAALKEYSDGNSISAWARKRIALAVAKGIVTGFPDNTLRSDVGLTGNQFTTLMLKAAGSPPDYSQAGTIFNGLTGSSSAPTQSSGDEAITRGQAVEMSSAALGASLNGSGTTLIQHLVTLGIVKKEVAIAAGFTFIEQPIFIAPLLISVGFSGVTPTATSTFSTTELQLTFDRVPEALSISDISVTGATKGVISGTGTTRTLTISGITVENGGDITVTISNPTGYNISPSSKTAQVVHLPVFTSGTPATYNTALNVSAGTALDATAEYKWYRSSDTVWDAGDTSLATGAGYTPVEADIGSYLIVTAAETAGGAVVSMAVSSAKVAKAAGSAVSGTINGTFPAAATSIRLTEFSSGAAGIEAAIAIDGTNFTTYSDINVIAGIAQITGLTGVTTSTKVKVRLKETATALAGPVQTISLTAEP